LFDRRRKPAEDGSKVLTVLVMPHDGGGIHQWQVPRWLLWGLVLFFVGSLAGAWWVIGRHVHYQAELARTQNLYRQNLQAAAELSRGRQSLATVAKLESDLRKMLAYKSKKALIRTSSAVGGPTPEDQKHLAGLLERQNAEGVAKLALEMEALENQASAQERSVEEIRRYVEQQRSLLARTPMGWPVRGWISSPFGSRTSPFSGSETFHAGIDVANDSGAPIRATADGTVTFSGWEGGYGKLVILTHGNGMSTFYGHCAQLKVAVGQKVRRGTVVALMGSTGESTGPHCHYEVRLRGVAVNPLKYLAE
jgi:murein DD-endopeptidase MepM/ murein hydrolase activator NlpD